ncbi:N-acetylglucosamine kinase [Flavitalea sp. BT771]|uniref:N-acetylglucosamine kinase n=1 Tax=Flavitalea sp. BT771 TaxID=3063329 RepID=UPI0026E1EBB2|nr:N-acetylglucosamine kinase [Flavitalea sp. BT771]MDO6432362.1 N-acetylglucosamine kinase [Flavitalea sp. BT771]MDV6221272.1 N-acetylglucosamine kinase [Flavitalea sp. BT771]
MNILIADSGATKCEWCLLHEGKRKKVDTQGISPYFLDAAGIAKVIETELKPFLAKWPVDVVYYYGTGCKDPKNQKVVQKALRQVFPGVAAHVTHDLMGAALSLCGDTKGIACILGTGSNSCYFDGRKISKNSPGLGFVLGDEGSGAYLGKKVLQYYLYNTFDEELRYKFDAKYVTDVKEILESVYKRPLPNRYLASFSLFLAENRGHYMIENIIEDGLNDFFFQHLCKYRESWKLPIHFVGGVAYGFRDVVKELCGTYEFELGRILQKPMDGLIKYHSES